MTIDGIGPPADDHTLPDPPHGLNYRRVRRRTTHHLRTATSITVSQCRTASEFVAMSHHFMLLAMQQLHLAIHYLLLSTLPGADEANQVDVLHRRGASILFSAIQSFNFSGQICIHIRRLLFFSAEDVLVDSIPTARPKRFRRIDEFDGALTHTGNVWSFTTIPDILVHADPNLVAWWTFDENMRNCRWHY